VTISEVEPGFTEIPWQYVPIEQATLDTSIDVCAAAGVVIFGFPLLGKQNTKFGGLGCRLLAGSASLCQSYQ
jgi:hypothetical protein